MLLLLLFLLLQSTTLTGSCEDSDLQLYHERLIAGLVVVDQLVVREPRAVLGGGSACVLLLQLLIGHGVDVPGLAVPELRVVAGSEAESGHEPVTPVERDAHHQPEVVEPLARDVEDALTKVRAVLAEQRQLRAESRQEVDANGAEVHPTILKIDAYTRLRLGCEQVGAPMGFGIV